jgi:hypothetical protein
MFRLSDGALAAIPYGGPWTAGTLGGLFDLAAALERPITLEIFLGLLDCHEHNATLEGVTDTPLV